MKAKDYILQYTADIAEPWLSKDIVRYVTEKSGGTYKPNYLKLLLPKLVVNNSGRPFVGVSGDFFYQRDGKLFAYNKEEYSGDYFGALTEGTSVERVARFLNNVNPPKELKVDTSNPTILLITQCSASKEKKECPAQDMYLGKGALLIKELLEQRLGKTPSISHYILSAGYGLVHGETRIKPYDNTFKMLKPGDYRQVDEALKVTENFTMLLEHIQASLVVLCLGKKYLGLININRIPVKHRSKVVLLGHPGLRTPGFKTINYNKEQLKRFGTGEITRKEAIISYLLTEYTLEELQEDVTYELFNGGDSE